MYVGTSGSIYVEKAHPAYPLVINFLVSCCEPVSRTHHVEHYRLDQASLSAASAEGTYTTEMIRNMLRYFRLNEHGMLPIDLTRYRQLEQWAASPQAETDPQSYRELRLHNSSETTVCSSSNSNGDMVNERPVKVLKLESGSAATIDDGLNVKKDDIVKVKKEPGITRRVLSLSGTIASAAVGDEGASMQQLTRSSPTQEDKSRVPLVALALTHSSSLQPLPPLVERMLREEEEASKMLIVLQPRLRRFHDMPAAVSSSSSSRMTANTIGAAATKDDMGELFYFLVSRDRPHLERVIEGVREFIEPVMLHGTPRWVISDVDRNAFRVEKSNYKINSNSSNALGPSLPGTSMQDSYSIGSAGSDRPAVLRRLLASDYIMDSNNNNSLQLASAQGYAMSDTAATRVVFKSQIMPGKLREVKERLFRVYGIRADCFYEYTQDPSMHVEQLSLASCVRLRHYQTASLERFRQGDKAHQGVVVLPCGAGKTLTGIGAAATLRKRTIVLCVNNMSVFQWRREFLRWTNLPPAEVTICTVHEKQMPGSVFITTYSMLIAKRPRRELAGRAAQESEAILAAVSRDAWGLLILDEVHTALAHHFQEVLNKVRYKCVLGLSATLLREDDKIADLRHLVGPKLYEANWLELTTQGYLARVECAEVQCPLPLSLFNAYVTAARRERGGFSTVTKTNASRSRGVDVASQHIASCNPYKLWCTQALLEFHRQRSPPDKVIIFCDYLADVRYYAHHLNLPFMDQRTSESERANLLQYFQFSNDVNAIILTRVGDVALDLPCASVIIQISGLGASRRQEAQRLGRILRPKPPSLDNTCSYFYTLVSQDTHEIRTSYERQSWLRDQGFGYRVLHCDRVLAEFARVGGQRCCIGPPQWWYQAHINTSSKTSLPATALHPRWRRAPGALGGEATYWAPFSLAASALLQQSFQRGKDSCTLSPSVLSGTSGENDDTVWPREDELQALHVRLDPSESWVVRFSSADAPETFGVVTIGTSEHPQMVRRVRWGTLDTTHDCMCGSTSTQQQQPASCLAYAVRQICGEDVNAAGVEYDAAEGQEGGVYNVTPNEPSRGVLYDDDDVSGEDEEEDDVSVDEDDYLMD